ncbi:MAG: hydrogenase maturation protease [Candidatus Marinimicrobia bacterium]|nr:hydrogenase maturation protease [Candidatus Neomarinimicrobiota bacterium]
MNFSTLDKLLLKYNKKEIVFVGLGNPDRGDDAAGLILLEELEKITGYSDSTFINAGKNPENHLQQILDHDPKIVIFIDSTESNKEPGTISLIESEKIDNFDFSTHTFSISLIEKYLLNYKKLEIIYIGIQPKLMKYGNEISTAVKNGIQEFFCK